MVLIYMFIVHVHILQSDIITSSLLVCNIDNKLYTISIKSGRNQLGNIISKQNYLGNIIIELKTKINWPTLLAMFIFSR